LIPFNRREIRAINTKDMNILARKINVLHVGSVVDTHSVAVRCRNNCILNCIEISGNAPYPPKSACSASLCVCYINETKLEKSENGTDNDDSVVESAVLKE